MTQENPPYFEYTHYPFVRPPEMSGQRETRPVVIVGAGPVGLTAALSLAHFGIETIVLEIRDCVSDGSRATCISRRSLEILDHVGPGPAITAKGIWWYSGSTFFRDKKVFSLEMAHSNTDKHPPFLNMQQCVFEQFLVDACLANERIDLRWLSKVIDLTQHDEAVALEVETPEGTYPLEAQYVAAADGAHSGIRQKLGLRFEGTSYEGRYLITDIELETDTPAERRVWFDPPSNPRSTIIMHCQPDNIWRFDCQLRPEEDEQAELDPERLIPRVQRHLDDIGETGAWQPVWSSLYKAHCLTIESYRHNRVCFIGDAAHLVPIFGVRGLNSGVEDAFNLGWKLAYALRGIGSEKLLDSFDTERVAATHENHRQATKSTWFMTPPGQGFTLMRDAVLSLAISQPWVRGLINPRQAAPFAYTDSALNGRDQAEPTDGMLPLGGVLPNPMVRLKANGAWTDGHLLDVTGAGFVGLVKEGDPSGADENVGAIADEGLPVRRVALVSDESGASDGTAVCDPTGALGELLGVSSGILVLIRPDDHICARLVRPDLSALRNALDTALG